MTPTAAIPILVLSASVKQDANIAFRAIQAGAIDVVEKPTGVLRADYDDVREDLIRRVKLVASVPAIRRARPSETAVEHRDDTGPVRVVAIAASTGGPPAFATVLGGLGADLAVPILAVQHITPGFLDGFVGDLPSRRRPAPATCRLASP